MVFWKGFRGHMEHLLMVFCYLTHGKRNWTQQFIRLLPRNIMTNDHRALLVKDWLKLSHQNCNMKTVRSMDFLRAFGASQAIPPNRPSVSPPEQLWRRLHGSPQDPRPTPDGNRKLDTYLWEALPCVKSSSPSCWIPTWEGIPMVPYTTCINTAKVPEKFLKASRLRVILSSPMSPRLHLQNILQFFHCIWGIWKPNSSPIASVGVHHIRKKAWQAPPGSRPTETPVVIVEARRPTRWEAQAQVVPWLLWKPTPTHGFSMSLFQSFSSFSWGCLGTTDDVVWVTSGDLQPHLSVLARSVCWLSRARFQRMPWWRSQRRSRPAGAAALDPWSVAVQPSNHRRLRIWRVVVVAN